MTSDGDGNQLEARVVGMWIALLREGAPPGAWVARDLWDLAVQAAAKVGSQGALRYYTTATEKMGLIEVELGAGKRKGRVRLVAPDDPAVFVPSLVEAGLDGEDLVDVVMGRRSFEDVVDA